MSAPDAATLSVKYDVECDFALGYWWINIYQEGWLTPVASFGPCAGFGADQAKQVQHEVRRWLETTLRAAIQAKMGGAVFSAQRNETRGRFVTLVGVAASERVEADEDGGIVEYKFKVPPESKYHDS